VIPSGWVLAGAAQGVPHWVSREGDDADHRSADGVATLVLEPLPERVKSVAL
jgi:hypothetical protein